MSQIENVITTTFRARDGGALAQMGSYSNRVTNFGRAIGETSRMSERLNAQWRAIGTTLRYAVAGGAVFGLTRMVGQLRDVQQQLGLMQAIGQPAGGSGIFSNTQITRLGNNLQRSAVQSITPINEINDATINLLSTVQNVPDSEIPGIITDIGRAAKLSQTPIEDLTKAATTMNIAFGRANNARTIGQFNRMWFSLIKEAPGGVSAAPQISQQLAPLASMFALGQGPVSGQESQAQMLSYVLGVLRTGSTPSTGLRGLTYLAQSLIQPTGKARGALAGIGITPQSIAREGIGANIQRLLKTITHTGNGRKIAGMDDETLGNLDESGGSLPGIPASEMSRLRTMIPRIHGIRAAVILAGQLRGNGQVLNLEQDLNLMRQSQANTVDQTHSMARAWQDYRKRAKLQEASVAINTMALQAAQAFEPILNLAARGITGIAGVAQHHRTATRAAILGGGAMLAALGVRRFLGFGQAGNAIVRGNAIKAAMSPGGVLGDSPQNPVYVTVVGQLFGSGQRGIGAGGGTSTGAKVAERGIEVAAVRAGMGLAGGGGLAAAGILAPLTVLGIAAYLGNKYDPNRTKSSAMEKVMEANRQRQMPGSVMPALGSRSMQGYASIDVNVNHPDGTKERKRVHVPLDLWPPGVVPGARARAGQTTRKR